MNTHVIVWTKTCLSLALCLSAIVMNAVPAYPGWQTKSQPDGSTITARLVGDEYAYYWETEDGKVAVERADGLFVKTDEAVPTPEQFAARRAQARAAMRAMQKAPISRAPKVAEVPQFPPRGLVILVNFADIQMDEAHTREVFDDMCNSRNCTTNTYKGINYGSAAQYYEDQSFGAYRPQFDVFGPVTLDHPESYYGEQVVVNGTTFVDGYAVDMVLEAAKAVEELGCDFTQYDADGDDYVDLVFYVFAGYGQHSGAGSDMIWPHMNYASDLMAYGLTHGNTGFCFSDDCFNPPMFDGKYLDMYACTSEMYINNLFTGIGTICHEFSHALGLPDLYDILNGSNPHTPKTYDLMDIGSYNGESHCPPNYSPWERAFLGWTEPVNPGNTFTVDTLHAHDSGRYNTYQINQSGELQGATEPGVCYYLENRRKTGWDTYIPKEGVLVWRTDYDAELWSKNKVNLLSESSETNRCIIAAQGCSEWTDVPGRPVTDIHEQDGMIIFRYMDDAADVEDIRYQNSDIRCQKVIRNRQLYILRDDNTYSVIGIAIR